MPSGIVLPSCPQIAPSGSPLDCPQGYHGVGGSPPSETPYVAPTSCKPWPLWFGCDFIRDPAGRLVVAAAPNACNGYGGQLQVWRYDEETDPSPTTSVTVETQGVLCVTLMGYPSGELELFYLLANATHQLQSRVSRDGGLTWGARTTYDFGFASATESAYYGGTAATGSLRVMIGWNPKSQVLLYTTTGLDLATGQHRAWYLTATGSAGGGWTFRPKYSMAINPQGSIQPLRDGSFVVCPGGARLMSLREDGSLSVVWPTTTGFGLGMSGYGAFDERTGMMLSMRPRTSYTAMPDGRSEKYKWYGWEVRRLTGNWQSWSAMGESRLYYLDGRRIDAYLYNAYSPLWPNVTESYWLAESEACALKVRGDGVWEFLRPDPAGQLVFARCRMLKVTAEATWEGVTIL